MENRTGETSALEVSGGADSASVAVFGSNTHFAFLYKKTEKLIAAIYMITDYVRDNEPLKWRIRDKALELLSLNIRFTNVSLAERRELLKRYLALSLEMVSLAGIAHMGGLISEMNYAVLKREFERIADTIERDENKKANEQTVILNPGFFEKEPDAMPAVGTNVLYTPDRVVSKGHIQKTSIPALDIQEKTASRIEKKIADNQKSDRKAIITKLLSKKSGLNIKDFSQAITGCSEKTIQRELLSMVVAGILKKEGERRWSTYSLVK